jgi:hypothetical protein
VDEFGNAIAVQGIEETRKQMLVGVGKGKKNMEYQQRSSG